MPVICVDFDGTIVEHRYPIIGNEVPGAIDTLLRLQRAGVKIILYTMRSDGQQDGDVLTQAVEWCRARGLEFWGVNRNPEQHQWTTSPKVYGQIYIDDAALGCPLRPSRRVGGRPMVDWEKVEELVMSRLE